VIQHDKENKKRRRYKAKREAQTKTQNIRFCKRTEWIPLETFRQSFTDWLILFVRQMSLFGRMYYNGDSFKNLVVSKGDPIMSNNNDQQIQPEKKKISLQEAMKQQLAKKKEAQAGGKQATGGLASNQRMQSQQTKKPSNTRRKMGS
jgi:hypothetical protein